MITITMQQLREKARIRPVGYVEAVLARGTVDGDNVLLTAEAVEELRKQFMPPPPEPLPNQQSPEGKEMLEKLQAARSVAPQIVVGQVRELAPKPAPQYDGNMTAGEIAGILAMVFAPDATAATPFEQFYQMWYRQEAAALGTACTNCDLSALRRKIKAQVLKNLPADAEGLKNFSKPLATAAPAG